MANESIPVFRPGGDLTATASGAVTGKTFVNITAGYTLATGVIPTVATAAAAGLTLGVAAYDAASGARVAVIAGPGTITPVTAGGTIAVGAEVEVGASGQAVTIASGKARGRAMSAGTSGSDVLIQLY